MPPKKPKSKRGKRQKKAHTFTVVTTQEIINPFENVRRAKRERQLMFRAAVKNKPERIRTTFVEMEKKGAPEVADIDDWLIETYENVYHPPVFAKGQKPNPGLEYDGGKTFTAAEGTRLNKLSLKELTKLAVNISKHKRKETVTEGVALTEKEFLVKQLALVQAQLKSRKLHTDTMERQRMDLDASIKYTNKVYNEKIKYTTSEHHQLLFNTKIGHLDLHLHKQQQYWKTEKEKYEKLLIDTENATYDNIMLDHVCREINLNGFARRQIVKEDYLMCLHTKIENLENYMTNTQEDVDAAIKAHVKELDVLKQRNFESLINNQDKSISEMRKFFQGVNTANASIIHKLKFEVNAKQFKLDRLERDLCRALEEQARFSIPLQTTNAELRKYEKMLEDAELVRNTHKKVWTQVKKLEKHVLRLKWKKEIEEVKFEKAKELLDHLQLAYSNAMLEVARKAGLALLIHSNTCSTLQTEANIYEISNMIMQYFATMDPKSPQGDSASKMFFENQDAEISKLRAQGILLKRKYDANRDAIYDLFERRFLRPLSTTGFQIPKLENTIAKGLSSFSGVSDDQLMLLGLDYSSSLHNAPCVV